MNKIKIAIIGAGGQAKETFSTLSLMLKLNSNLEFICFYETIYTKSEFLGYPVKSIDCFDPNLFYHIAIGDQKIRKQIVNMFPSHKNWFNIINPNVNIGLNVNLGIGVYIASGVIITESISIGNHTHLNIACTVSHDVIIGDYCTLSPGSRILGKCILGHNVFIGASATIRDNIKIVDDTFIGMSSAVVEDINSPGTYVGVPSKKI